MKLSPALLERVRAGDLATLVRLDDDGLLLGPGESLAQYAERLATLAKNLDEFYTELRAKGEVDLFNSPLRVADQIPAAAFAAAQAKTQALYGFAIDWVPGFYSNYRMGLLFAGCAYYDTADFFAVFVVRGSFRARERWLIYSRTELLAHELCHIAHIAFPERNYEELFAYQTATSGFRRLVGGMLRTTRDTYALVATALGLLAAQIVNITLRPPEAWNTFPMPLLFALAALVGAGILGRYLWHRQRWLRARAALAATFGPAARAVSFRCSEDELRRFAADPASAQAPALAARAASDPRWQVILRKFPQTAPTATPTPASPA